MSVQDISNEIERKKMEFDAQHEEVSIQGNEALLIFSKRIAALSNSTKKNYSFIYHGEQIRAVPGCTDFDILYQMIQINARQFASGNIKYEDMPCQPGMEYRTFGNEILARLQENINVNATFNGITIPFTTDMSRSVVYGGSDIGTDSFTFTSMFNNMRNAKYKYYDAIEGCNLSFDQGSYSK